MAEYYTRKHFIKRVMSFLGVGILWLWGRRFMPESAEQEVLPDASVPKAKKASLTRPFDV